MSLVYVCPCAGLTATALPRPLAPARDLSGCHEDIAHIFLCRFCERARIRCRDCALSELSARGHDTALISATDPGWAALQHYVKTTVLAQGRGNASDPMGRPAPGSSGSAPPEMAKPSRAQGIVRRCPECRHILSKTTDGDLAIVIDQSVARHLVYPYACTKKANHVELLLRNPALDKADVIVGSLHFALEEYDPTSEPLEMTMDESFNESDVITDACQARVRIKQSGPLRLQIESAVNGQQDLLDIFVA